MNVQDHKTKLRIIVIEDESLVAMDICNMIEDLGHDLVGVAGTLNRALELIEKTEDKIDAALVDANLGGVSAVPVADALSKAKIPYILTSGYEQEELRHLGFPEHTARVEKPYGCNDIRNALLTIQPKA